VNFIALIEQELCEVRPILASDAGYQCFFHFFFNLNCNLWSRCPTRRLSTPLRIEQVSALSNNVIFRFSLVLRPTPLVLLFVTCAALSSGRRKSPA
jgi:hypothetical protein